MSWIASYFRFDELNTNWRAEATGGLTTFMTMAYVVVVHPGILSEAMGEALFGELLFATCASAAFGTLLMALLANYPFALAPGMGLNAFLPIRSCWGWAWTGVWPSLWCWPRDSCSFC
jgi:AGZA family xanthine/uracil permease-like MFS transporter